MGLIDIIIIGVIVLFALVGFFRGFIRTLINFLSGTIADIAAIFLAKPVAGLLNSAFKVNVLLGNLLANPIGNYVASASIPFGESGVTGDAIASYLSGSLSGIIKYIFGDLFSSTTVYANEEELVTALSIAIGTVITLIIGAIIVAILIKIAISVIAKIFIASNGTRLFGGLDKILGLAIGLLKGAFLVSILMLVTYALTSIPTINTIVENYLTTNSIFGYLYPRLTQWFMGMISSINFNELISKYININI